MDIRKIYQYALQCEHEGKRFFEQNAERLSRAAAVGGLVYWFAYLRTQPEA